MTTVAVDFDGVIHRYSKGWADGTIYDEPIEGSLESLRDLMDKFAVFIFTSRYVVHVSEWLEERGFKTDIDDSRFHHTPEWNGDFWDTRGVLLITNKKIAAAAYIDDRAIRFESWTQALADLESYVRC